jgi:microsomal dipeptidase-like Zn-dependent dipeptidase
MPCRTRRPARPCAVDRALARLWTVALGCALSLSPAWAAGPCAFGPDTCQPGFVWREAFAGDHVCVPGTTRAQAAQDNQLAASRRNPNGGPYGPDTCQPGFVWREARPADHVCVPGATRTAAAQDNQAAPTRRVAVCEAVWGWGDLHAHPFADEGFGRNLFFGKAYGDMASALPHCDAEHGIGGINDLAGMAMHAVYGNGFPFGHKVGGFPEFDGWPRWDDVTHQAMHEAWLRRAVDGGMRLLVAHAVNNEWLCATMKGINPTLVYIAAAAAGVPLLGLDPGTVLADGSALAGVVLGAVAAQVGPSQAAFLAGQVEPDCQDMPSVERQIAEAYAMQTSIDSRSGGAGQGWFRIVTTPEQAIAVMRQNKLAVVLGIEVDNLFGCGRNGSCSEAWVTSQLDRYHAMGVRHIFPVHLYDNAFGGSASTNVLVTRRWKNPMVARDCSAFGYTYDSGRCNALGLTPLGRFLINQLALRGMLIDIDHMSQATFTGAMDLLQPMDYPVISGHTGFADISLGSANNEGAKRPADLARIQAVGGMVAVIPHQGGLAEIGHEATPGATQLPHDCGNSSETTAQAYLYAIHHMGAGQPVGIGTDFNGFASEPGPRFGSDACHGGRSANAPGRPMMGYPFTIQTHGGQTTLNKSQSGSRTFDFNFDGLAHIGLVPDLIADFQALGMTASDLDPLFDSAAGYVRLWAHARTSARHAPGTRQMTLRLRPDVITADTAQTFVVLAEDAFVGDGVPGAQVFIDNQLAGAPGQPVVRTVVSHAVPVVCRTTTTIDPGTHRPVRERECTPAHREAAPLQVLVRAPGYADRSVALQVQTPGP